MPDASIEPRAQRVRAATLGLDVGKVGKTVRSAVGGTVVTRFTEGDREFDVRVRFPRELVHSAAQLGSVPLFPRSGAPVRVRDVARVYEGSSPQTIFRENQNRLVRVTAQPLSSVGSTGEATAAVRTVLKNFVLPGGYTVRFGGQEKTIAANQRVFISVLGLAVFLVFAVMAVQYESFSLPLAIMGAIILALIGVVGSLGVAGLPVLAPVMLGMILLAGIVVNNGILLVEYIEQRRKSGLGVTEAILQAAPLRVRPILMTVSTTVVGMLPLALNPVEGAELMSPLAVAVSGGLTMATGLTFFWFPRPTSSSWDGGGGCGGGSWTRKTEAIEPAESWKRWASCPSSPRWLAGGKSLMM